MSNTELWDRVFATDPSHTSQFMRTGGFKGTAIKPLYLIHKATEIWGPMGSAWGAETIEHVIHKDMVFIKARIWYPGDDLKSQTHVGQYKAYVEHWGGDVLIKTTKSGERPNDEAFKMAFTDAVGKCLSQLGFSADVHMGRFDDSKYVESVKKKETAASMKKRFAEIKDAICKGDPAVVWGEHIEAIKAFKAEDPTFYDDLVATAKERKNFLSEGEK